MVVEVCAQFGDPVGDHLAGFGGGALVFQRQDLAADPCLGVGALVSSSTMRARVGAARSGAELVRTWRQ